MHWEIRKEKDLGITFKSFPRNGEGLREGVDLEHVGKLSPDWRSRDPRAHTHGLEEGRGTGPARTGGDEERDGRKT